MKIETITENGVTIAVISDSQNAICDEQSAMELALRVKYETGAERIALEKGLFCEKFLILSTGLAGAVLQKFINYRLKAAIYGDFSYYTSKPLKDFIYESNRGRDFFFTATRAEAIEKLREAQ